VVIAYAYRTEDPGLESRQGVRFIGKQSNAAVYTYLMDLICMFLCWKKINKDIAHNYIFKLLKTLLLNYYFVKINTILRKENLFGEGGWGSEGGVGAVYTCLSGCAAILQESVHQDFRLQSSVGYDSVSTSFEFERKKMWNFFCFCFFPPFPAKMLSVQKNRDRML
jgi:hypothetical protein